jgi:zinc transporter ZupT
MDGFELRYVFWAVSLGGLSAASLPLGSLVGLLLQPRATLAAILAAFGAGALIAALSVELVAPTVAALGQPSEHGDAVPAFWALLLGAVAGGILFVLLDRLVAERGGFLRKASTAISWFTRRQYERDCAMLRELCAVPLLRALPAAEVQLLLRDVGRRVLSDEQVLFREGDPSEALYLVRNGQIELQRGGASFSSAGPRSVLGELGLVAGVPRTLAAMARGTVEVFEIQREAFERWRARCPEFDAGVRRLATQRLAEVLEQEDQRSEDERRWGMAAIAALNEGSVVPSPGDLRRASEQHGGAGLAVWLGMLIDGVPESIVIGSGLAGLLSVQLAAHGAVSFAEVVPYTLIAGLFLSNFPEALSSSVGMRTQGWHPGRVFSLWALLLVVTAVGAGVGYLLGEVVPHVALIGVEGVAAGAMLTMLTATMIPEAVELSGSGTRAGLATLLGFLGAISFKLLE